MYDCIKANLHVNHLKFDFFENNLSNDFRQSFCIATGLFS